MLTVDAAIVNKNTDRNPIFMLLMKITAYYLIAFSSMLLGLFTYNSMAIKNVGLHIIVCGLLCIPTAYFYSVHTLLYKVDDRDDKEREAAKTIIRGIYGIAITFGTFYVLDIFLNVLIVNDSLVMLRLKFMILLYCAVFFLCALFYRLLSSKKEKFHQYRIVRYQLLIPSMITIALSYYTGYVLKFYLQYDINRELVLSWTPFYPVFIFISFIGLVFLSHRIKKDDNKKYISFIVLVYIGIIGALTFFAIQNGNRISNEFLNLSYYLIYGVVISAFLAIFEGAHTLGSLMFDSTGNQKSSISKNYHVFSYVSTIIFMIIFLLNNFIDILTIDFNNLLYKLISGVKIEIENYSMIIPIRPMFYFLISTIALSFGVIFYSTDPDQYEEKAPFSIAKLILSVLSCGAFALQLVLTVSREQIILEYQSITNFLNRPLFCYLLFLSLLVLNVIIITISIYCKMKKRRLSTNRLSYLQGNILLLSSVLSILAFISRAFKGIVKDKLILSTVGLAFYTIVLLAIYFYLFFKGGNHRKLIPWEQT